MDISHKSLMNKMTIISCLEDRISYKSRRKINQGASWCIEINANNQFYTIRKREYSIKSSPQWCIKAFYQLMNVNKKAIHKK